MTMTESVRHRLNLGRELLTGITFPATPQQLACELLLSHDAATLALGAICHQLGRPSDKIRDSLPDYLVWLRGSVRPEKTPPGMDYFIELHQARIELQDRYLLPAADRWIRVQSVTLEHIENCITRYLVPEPSPAGISKASAAPASPPANTVTDESQRRRCPRYECAGDAEVRIPFVGPPEKARIINLSLEGCYAEMDQPFDVGRRVEMVLCINGLSFRATGKVVYSQWGRAGEGKPTRYDNPGIGIHFTGMSSGGHSRLQELITELQAKSSAPAR
jgi:PilZ domain-containing protein